MKTNTHLALMVKLWAWVFCVAVGSVENMRLPRKMGVGVILHYARARVQ